MGYGESAEGEKLRSPREKIAFPERELKLLIL